MRNRLNIAVTDYTGTRHYSVTQVVGRIALTGLVIVVTAMFLSAVTIIIMRQDIETLEHRRDRVERLHRDLQIEAERLQGAIFEKESSLDSATSRLAALQLELEQVSDELAEIEVMIGLRPDPDADMRQRLDTASQTALEKSAMLQLVPSGSPTEEPILNSGFGFRKHPLGGKRQFHGGVDLRAELGEPVYAAADGIVESANMDKKSGFGNLIVIAHFLGFKTLYGHLDSIEVAAGEFVEKGQVVGKTGATGRVSGPHLHYEVRYLRKRLDPVPFIEWGMETYDTLFESEERVPWDSLAKAIKRRPGNSAPRLSLREPASLAN